MTHSVAWIGPASGPELAWTRGAVAELADVHEFPDTEAACAAAAGPPWPAVVLLAGDMSGRWGLADLTALARRWPLAPLVSVATSIVDGRRRSGPPLPATEEVPWSEVPARLAWWLADRAAGRPGTLGLPTTARREERALEAAAALRPAPRPAAARVSVAAERPIDLEGLADVVTASGRDVLRRTCGRPPLDEPAEILVWDCECLGAAHLAWLRLLAANRPELRVVVIDSFPRPETALAALGVGAAAVLGRPLAPEALAGAFSRLESGPSAGLGRTDEHR
ncbi:MAG: hypothetical protein ACKOSQ_01775 [Planctomycetaceae bacterium]